MTVKLLVGDVRDRIREIPDGSIDLIATSPPFLALRKYGDNAAEMGSERTPADFLDALLELTTEFRRVLTPHGSIAIELGDTYSGSGGAGGDYGEGGLRDGQAKFTGSASRSHGLSGGDTPWPKAEAGPRRNATVDRAAGLIPEKRGGGNGWPLAKSLTLIPTLYPASLAYGWNMLNPAHTFARWRVRNVIVWARPNPPVGALGDKVRPATSYITVACTSAKRWFDLDAVRTEYKPGQSGAASTFASHRRGDADGRRGGGTADVNFYNGAGAPPLDWWEDDDPTGHATLVLPTQPYPGAHYATWPEPLAARLIKMMCPLRVCTTCGEPSRRIVNVQPDAALQQALARHIEERRKANGITRSEMVPWFIGRYKNADSITAQVSNWELAKNVPSPADWLTLKERLGLSDEFDAVVLGDRQWTESTVEYGHISDHSSGTTQDATGRIYNRLPATKSRHAPDCWSDCGHDTWRSGTILDPFAGSGTTLAVAQGLGRDATGIELYPENAYLCRQRIGMYLDIDGAVA